MHTCSDLLSLILEGGQSIDKIIPLINETELKKTNDLGMTSLHIASKEGYREIVQEIITYLKNQNYTLKKSILEIEDKKKWTPLYYAIDGSENGFPEIVESLIRAGAEINTKDFKGIAPLHVAAYKGQDDNVEILLKHKADPNITDNFGRTPIHYAIIESQTNSVQALLDAKCDVNCRDNQGNSLIHYSILCKGNALLYIILFSDYGVNLDIANNDHDTALILAAKNGIKDNIRTVQKMLELKADPYLENSKGESFYSIVSQEAIYNNFIYDDSSDEEVDEKKKNANLVDRVNTSSKATERSSLLQIEESTPKRSSTCLLSLFFLLSTLVLIFSHFLKSEKVLIV